MIDTLALKAQSEASSCMSFGKAIQSRTVLGKKDIFLLSVLQVTADGLESVPCLPFWRNSLLSFLMAISLLSTLYSMQRPAPFCLSCRDNQFKPWSMSLTLNLKFVFDFC